MATLKDHQQAMVDLLAHGSAIPASAMRLAHAMHDVLAYLNLEEAIHHAPLYGADATTPGLNDKALAADVEACRPKDTMFDRARAAERRVKELENTVTQLRASNAKLRAELTFIRIGDTPEQAGCRKEYTQVSQESIDLCHAINDTQVCEHEWSRSLGQFFSTCTKCGAIS